MKARKTLVTVIVVLISLMVVSTASAGGGFDDWGYNDTAGQFDGGYCEAYQNDPWCLPWADYHLKMKWNDDWLNRYGVRHDGLPTYIDSGAWLTNHQSLDYELDGQQCHWFYKVLIKAGTSDGYVNDGNWYDEDGILLGEQIWGDFYIGFSLEGDNCTGTHGPPVLTDPGHGR